jgi:hypothetical protein
MFNFPQSPNLSNISSLSGSMGNIAKPIVEGSSGVGIQQMLPFKLSQNDAAAASATPPPSGGSPSGGGHSNSMKKNSSSPRPGYQKLASSSDESVSHQRTGSSPAQMPPATAGPRHVNTLPKSGSMNAPSKKVDYSGGEDKVIYF